MGAVVVQQWAQAQASSQMAPKIASFLFSILFYHKTFPYFEPRVMVILALATAVKQFAKRHLNGHRTPGQIVAIAALGILLAAIAKYPDRALFVRARPDLKRKTVPGHPLLGNVLQALTAKENPLHVLKASFDQYGDLYTLTVPGRGRIFLVNHPDYIEYILKTNFDNYIKGSIFSDQVRDFFGEGIFVTDGDEWRFHRKTAITMFTTKLYRQVTHGAFTIGVRNLCAVLDKHEARGQPAELQGLFQKMTIEAFGKLTFGIDVNSLNIEGSTDFEDAFDYMMHNVDNRVANPFWKWTDWLIPGKVAKVRHAIGVMDKHAYMAIEKRKHETEEEREKRPKDLLDHFLSERDDGTITSDVNIRDVFVGFMIAGRDTTAFALTWQFYSLMANPRIMKNVLKEIDIVLQGSEEYAFETMLNELPYLKAVFHETLRLHPPAPRNIRETANDDILPDGTPIYKGDKIAFSSWCMGRNRSVWGEDAEIFVPERWLVDDDGVSSHASSGATAGGRGVSPFGKFKMENQYKFNSFSAGPRLCLGQTFATVEAMVTSCMLLQNFELRLVPGQPLPEPKPSGALPMLNGLMVQPPDMTTYTMVLVGLRRYIDRQLSKSMKRSPFEYMVFATIGMLVAAMIKYPNRAFLTRARPDLKDKTVKGFPLLGNMPQMLRDRDDNLNSMNMGFQHFGDMFSLTIPLFGRIILINSPELNEHVLKTNFDNYIKGKIFRDQLQDILGRGIFVSDQEEWRFHRKTAANIFTTKLYRQLVEGIFLETGLDLCSVLERSRLAQHPVDLQELFLKLTLDAFGKLTFGLEFNALLREGPNEFGDAFDYLTANVDGRSSNPFWFLTDRIIPGKMRKLQRAIGVLDKFAKMAVDKRRNESAEEKEARPGDLLDLFINHVAEDGTKLTDVELRDVFVNFMIAGRDTTAQGLTWQFYSLMTNPRVMRNLILEIDTVLQGSQAYTYETMLHELPYLKAVFHETLRLYPPVPKNVKMAVDDDVLPGGIRVYKGDVIGVSSYCLGRNKSVWGEDAEQFVPERWLVPGDHKNTTALGGHTNNGSDSKAHGISPFGKFKTDSQYKFTSFNAGPRLCLGQTFAILEAMVTSTLLLQKYQFKLVPGQRPAIIKPSATIPMLHPLLTTMTSRVQNLD
ncbi:hypothetical protein BGZ65_006660 [Modicella reniformis]|uniref:Cytochrome P450 n=1 Tax=Modicella reniformis TaxID=1440133 RepID=A0A9P6MLK1_9FUNG|nr:hypothetical protein BGZ65_006660 [Modicella reniformis]